ncbi:MAG: PaaI family thioesterase [Paracoccaceae bacterium]|jgi:uncharacterized protein (TIGR00369 family)|nr:PaaI family thioesterase [Paracoccaceae bacterium]MDP7184671.1 PaaI family thioesterase [Paracoccaceae bacterium]
MESRAPVNAEQFMKALPHCGAMNMQLQQIGKGQATIGLPYDDRFVGDPDTGVLHGGAISAVVDTCCGAAVMSHPSVKGATATIDLRIEYLRSAAPRADIVTTAECYHVTRSVAFVRASAHDGDTSKPPVATASGTFMVSAVKP